MSKPRGASEARQAEPAESIAVVVDAVDGLKAFDLLVLDLRGIASFTDYLVMCTGSSDRHVQAVADGIREKLRVAGVTPLHTEGYEQASWVLVDYVDFLVNVFTAEARAFYQLDRVWRDAPVIVGERPEAPPGGDESPEDEGGAAVDDADA
ncbi:MAG: ribosome silencing factor [Polyangiales bacterium]